MTLKIDTVETVAKHVRSKNAGPFWLTIDVFCHNVVDTKRIAQTFEHHREQIAHMYGVQSEAIEIYCLEPIQVAKISMPRVPIEGSRDEIDMHGGQMYVSLLTLEVQT